MIVKCIPGALAAVAEDDDPEAADANRAACSTQKAKREYV